jgi:hypothetical protein
LGRRIFKGIVGIKRVADVIEIVTVSEFPDLWIVHGITIPSPRITVAFQIGFDIFAGTRETLRYGIGNF